jgi:hypothetical protein
MEEHGCSKVYNIKCFGYKYLFHDFVQQLINIHNGFIHIAHNIRLCTGGNSGKTPIVAETRLLMTSLARVFLSFFAARVTRDVTAPNELAVALPFSGVLMCVISATTTQHITSIWSETSAVTQSSLGPHRPSVLVVITIVRRPFQVHQITLTGLFMSAFGTLQFQEDRLASPPTFYRDYLFGLFVLFHESLSNVPKSRQCSPTSLHSTWPGHTVALTFSPRTVLHSLQNRQEIHEWRIIQKDNKWVTNDPDDEGDDVNSNWHIDDCWFIWNLTETLVLPLTVIDVISSTAVTKSMVGIKIAFLFCGGGFNNLA